MNAETKADPPDEGEQKSLLKKLSSLFSFGKPGTKEDLELEIQELLEEGEEQGLISSLEERMINSIFDFRDTQAAEIMTPVAEVISFEISSSVEEIVDGVVKQGFTRIPIYRENPDRVIGIIHVKDLLKLAMNNSSQVVSLEDFLLPIYFIPEAKPIVDLLRDFQKRKAHMAMVTDEFGAIRGLITMEDILEEIVGEIDDEYDDEQDKLEEIGDGMLLAHARIDIEKIERHFGVTLPEGLHESLGGLLIHLLGRLGAVGDIVESSGLRFEITNATNRHILQVHITDMRAKS
ncbi:hemolysin family protein [Desulfotalea psychrophila]|uniref:CBS domain-containing protein n=1 Tax=Desulfotalea psychrophila (strain LSv54 / DSM 12343) TaxID=177439 RepID=Q6AM85_DESPS|nr:transporter associated domain-containing protein [Desulfotalea psychrophila]CAG36540.1 conserved hypothetical protein [Desulfotalea psychrophila LSv54]